jgi:hypothetical protein
MLGEPSKLKLAGLLAVMGKLASAEPLVSYRAVLVNGPFCNAFVRLCGWCCAGLLMKCVGGVDEPGMLKLAGLLAVRVG